MKDTTFTPTNDPDRLIVSNPHITIEVSADLDHETLSLRRYKNVIDYHYREIRYPGDNLARWTGEARANEYLTPATVKEAKRRINKQIKAEKEMLILAHNHPMYKLLEPIADQILKSYRADFTYHDAKCIYQNNPNNLIWIVGDSHTHIYIYDTPWTAGCIKYNTETRNEDKFYFIRNGKIKEITRQDLPTVSLLLSKPPKID